MHRIKTNERVKIKGTAHQKMARRHSKEGGNHLKQDTSRQVTMEGTAGAEGLHAAVDGQSLSEVMFSESIREQNSDATVLSIVDLLVHLCMFTY